MHISHAHPTYVHALHIRIRITYDEVGAALLQITILAPQFSLKFTHSMPSI
ncbi:uncharacterized protein G2W53_021805 [Senna tora]|uniref:Uncharacterized protein n=1 Tax=Senna tora TaxID=362788 RepID=A0A834TMK8_9FABA|nr:uncharacterized protein G2W53_021805 [Senna tora]